MSAPPHVMQTLRDLEEKLAEQEKGVLALKKQINSFCEMFDLSPRFTDVGTISSTRARLKPDQFVNDRSPGAAVQHALRLRGKDAGAMPIEEIYILLRDHGFEFDRRVSDEKQIAGLRIAIGKDRKLRRIPANDTVGLASWYRAKRKSKKNGDDSGNDENESDDRNEHESDDENENENENESDDENEEKAAQND